MAKTTKTSLGRRGFLKGAAAGAAAIAAAPQLTKAQAPAERGNATAPAPNGPAVARENGAAQPATPGRFIEHPGSDFMVDVLKTLNIEYLGSNPGSTFESLHESLINYGQNKMPEFLTCTHEENAVAMAHGYAKIEGKPMMALIHGNIGLQHAGMAIYNAYCDRVPVFMVVGNHADGAERNPGVQTFHSAQDLGAQPAAPAQRDARFDVHPRAALAEAVGDVERQRPLCDELEPLEVGPRDIDVEGRPDAGDRAGHALVAAGAQRVPRHRLGFKAHGRP